MDLPPDPGPGHFPRAGRARRTNNCSRVLDAIDFVSHLPMLDLAFFSTVPGGSASLAPIELANRLFPAIVTFVVEETFEFIDIFSGNRFESK